jgi:hypothetical protein
METDATTGGRSVSQQQSVYLFSVLALGSTLILVRYILEPITETVSALIVPDPDIVVQAHLKALEFFLDGHIHGLLALCPPLEYSEAVADRASTAPTPSGVASTGTFLTSL